MYRYPQNFAISIFAFSDLDSFEIVLKKSEVRFWNARLILTLREGKHSETKVAITQASGRSCCGHSGSGVLELDFNWTSLYSHILIAAHMYKLIYL